jgi:hypothetical protein
MTTLLLSVEQMMTDIQAKAVLSPLIEQSHTALLQFPHDY